MSIVSSHHHCQPSITHERCGTEAVSKVSCSRYCSPCFSGRLAFSHRHSLCLKSTSGQTGKRRFSRICSVVDDGMNPDDSDEEEKESLDDQTKRVCKSVNLFWFLKFIRRSQRVFIYFCCLDLEKSAHLIWFVELF